MNKKLVVIVGAGPCIGIQVAKKFGANQFRVVLVSRNQNALDQYTAELRSEGIESYGVVADASITTTLTAAFESIKKNQGAIDVLVYNAALLEGGKPSFLTAESLVSHFQVDVTSALHSAQQVIPDQLAKKAGTILFTGGFFAMNPSVDFAALSIGKAGIRNLATTLAEELNPLGICARTQTSTGNCMKNVKIIK